ncbi:MAG: molybdopterin-dependent oxidoreductase [Chloroflexi bacterium]|nr:molybdopterin-dependent oxidoreductase [Chloroflexota bacterium]
MSTQKIPEYCYQCVAGPDLLNVCVEDGVATRIEPNWKFGGIHPGRGTVCVKAYGLIQKTYNPYRVKKPMVRTNPRKGRNEDPQWKEVSWDDALDLVAQKLLAIKAKGLRDENGYPRLAVTFGSGGIAPAYTGTLPALLGAWGPIDFGIGSGQGVKCYHSEHLYGEFWHRAFTVQSDTPRTKYLISFGNNNDASGGVLGVWRHAQARADGMKRVQFEPHLSVTGAHAEWVPIKPKTDAAVMFAMLHVILHENDWKKVCDVPHLKKMTNSPYLIAPDGMFLRDAESRKPLMWDASENRARAFDEKFEPAMAGEYVADGITIGADGEVCTYVGAQVETAFQKLLTHVQTYTPEWAEKISDVSAATTRRVANEFLAHANVGGTIEIEGRTYPHRPVAILLGKTVTNGWGGYECVWARTLMATLVGSLEVPGGTIGTTVRLNRPGHDRLASARPGPDGFMDQPLNPTDKQNWQAKPKLRNAYQTLVPLAGNSPWSAALGPAHLPWLFMKNPPDNWPRPTTPDVWITYRTNPAISHWDSDTVSEMMATFPFIVSLAYTVDETNWNADVLLPEATDLESYQLYRIGGTKYIEQYWKHQGFAIRQPAVKLPVDARDLCDIATELAKRLGMLNEYIAALNKGGGTGIPLKSAEFDFSLPSDVSPSTADIWDRACKAATREMSGGKAEHDLAWFKENGAFFVPFPEKDWFLHGAMEDKGLRYELPYQERIWRSGKELANRLHEQRIEWWDVQLQEYQPMPKWKDFPDIWARIAEQFDKKPDDFDLWLLTSRSMQYSWGSNVGIPVLADVAKNIRGHSGVMMNAATGKKLGIQEGDWVWIESPIKRVKGHAILREGVRPDCAVTLQQFGHWVTPVAKDLDMPNMNALTPLHLAITDATGSGADVVRVRVYKA